MSATKYDYAKECHLTLLTEEITASAIVTALDFISYEAPTTSIWFKAALSAEDIIVLDDLVTAHDKNIYVAPIEVVKSIFERVEDDSKIPYVIATDRPMNHYSYFSCAGDSPTIIGDGAQALFSMTASDTQKIVDIAYNEHVYVKDGLIHPENAPFGAMVDIDIVHPLYGILLSFAKNAPILGSYPIEMNTEDKASLAAGLIVRITVHNSTGLNGTDAPAAFKAIGRLELYRPKPPGT